MLKDEQETYLRRQAIDAATAYYQYAHGAQKAFKPGDCISYGGRIFDEREITNLVDAALDFWLTTGRYTERFEVNSQTFSM
ncbi:MAG TPA: hypothetical protein PLI53_08295 [Geobacteraceae bacterium]|nr:hypothetical protein [Geobacteraceae bacterium]